MYLAFAFILIGIVYFLKNLGLLDDISWSLIWPALLVVLGVSILLKKTCHHCGSAWCKDHSHKK